MKTKTFLLLELALAVTFAGAAVPSFAQTQAAVATAAAAGISFRNVVRRVSPSVVTVVSARAVTQRGAVLGRESKPVAVGSGVVIDADGFIVSNAHVVEDSTELIVVLSDGTVRPARIVGEDVDTDVTLLKVDGGPLQPIAMGDMGEVAVGDVVLAVGNPRGVGQTVTQGIVSGIRSVAVRDRLLEHVVQTDAAINPGNSGGALVDMAGRLIGINCVILSQSGGSEGIGFAIPVDVVAKVAADIRKSGRLPHAWLGLLMNRNSAETGAPVLAVEEGAPAQRAGLKAGDVVVSIGNRAIAGPNDLTDALLAGAPGTTVNVCVQRDGHRSCTDVVLAARPATRGGIRMLGATVALGSD